MPAHESCIARLQKTRLRRIFLCCRHALLQVRFWFNRAKLVGDLTLECATCHLAIAICAFGTPSFLLQGPPSLRTSLASDRSVSLASTLHQTDRRFLGNLHELQAMPEFVQSDLSFVVCGNSVHVVLVS